MDDLSRGDTGEKVEELQKKLKELGFDVGKSDGIFGPRTEQALKDFQRENRIWTDGIAGDQVDQALKKDLGERDEERRNPIEHAFKKATQAVTDTAKHMVADSKHYTPENTASVDEYRRKRVQAAKDCMYENNEDGKFCEAGVPWCAGFDNTIRNRASKESGLEHRILPNSLSVLQVKDEAGDDYHDFSDKKDTYEVKPGDSLVLREPGGGHHIGVVTKVDSENHTITTIAGNSMNSEVHHETYTMDDRKIMGAIDEGALYQEACNRQMAGNNITPSNTPVQQPGALDLARSNTR